MSGGRDSEAEFQQFFKSLIQPSKANADEQQAHRFGVRDVIVNGPLRCKIYIGIPPQRASGKKGEEA
jgi:hypothetical protein